MRQPDVCAVLLVWKEAALLFELKDRKEVGAAALWGTKAHVLEDLPNGLGGRAWWWRSSPQQLRAQMRDSAAQPLPQAIPAALREGASARCKPCRTHIGKAQHPANKQITPHQPLPCAPCSDSRLPSEPGPENGFLGLTGGLLEGWACPNYRCAFGATRLSQFGEEGPGFTKEARPLACNPSSGCRQAPRPQGL